MKNTNYLSVVILLISGSYSYCQNQSKVWHFDGRKIDFSSGTPQVQSHFLSSSAAAFSIGMYGTTNNSTLFYVSDNAIYNGFGVLAGSIGTTALANMTNMPSGCDISPPSPPSSPGCQCGYELAASLSAVPVPGSCSKYYLIYFNNFLGHCSPHGSHFDLRYSIFGIAN